MKQFKHFLLTVAMLLCSTSISADAVVVVNYDFKVDGICYDITSETDNTVRVTYNDYYYYDNNDYYDRFFRSYNYKTKYSGTVTIPESVTYNGTTYSVTSIGDNAFGDCSGLTSVTIGNSVTSIGYSAFSGCSGLKSITSYIPAEKLFTLQTSGFEGVDKTGCILYVPKGAKEKYATTDGWKDFMNIVEILETYKVTFVVDGEVFATDSVTEGNSLVFPNVPEKEGHKFLGWSEAPEIMPANDVTITGEYKVNTYTVMYVVDGEVIESYPVEYGKELVMMPLAPEKEGHTFMGWCELPATMPAEDVTVTGTFKVNTYAVAYVVDGVTIATDSVVYGTAVTLIDELEKEGYSFSWSEAPETMPANDITITGEYKVNTYAVKYVVDGEVIVSYPMEYGKELVMLPLAPEKEGHTFMGWSELPATMPAEDVTVTGTFKVNTYAITYVVDGVTYATDSVEYGAAITLPEVPEKENSTFEWEEAPTTMPASDVTIYGNYVSGIGGVTISGKADVYTLNGMLYKRDVDLNNLSIELPKGVYIINGKKIMVK